MDLLFEPDASRSSFSNLVATAGGKACLSDRDSLGTTRATSLVVTKTLPHEMMQDYGQWKAVVGVSSVCNSPPTSNPSFVLLSICIAVLHARRSVQQAPRSEANENRWWRDLIAQSAIDGDEGPMPCVKIFHRS